MRLAPNNTLKMDAVSKVPTGADGNSTPDKKDKLDYSIDSRIMRVSKDEDVRATRGYRLVAKMLTMSHLCGVSHPGLSRLMCPSACWTRQQSMRSCQCNQRQRRTSGGLSARAHAQRAH